MTHRLMTAFAVAMGLATITGCASYGDFALQTVDGLKVSLSDQKG